LAGTLAQHPPSVVAEDELAAKMPLTLERGERLLVERDLPRLAALRRAHHPTSDRAPHEQSPPHEIHVLPAEREQLALPEAGREADGDHRRPLSRGALLEPSRLVEV